MNGSARGALLSEQILRTIILQRKVTLADIVMGGAILHFFASCMAA